MRYLIRLLVVVVLISVASIQRSLAAGAPVQFAVSYGSNGVSPSEMLTGLNENLKAKIQEICGSRSDQHYTDLKYSIESNCGRISPSLPSSGGADDDIYLGCYAVGKVTGSVACK